MDKHNKNKRPDLIIFDMDGLMLDTEPIAIDGWMAAALECGLDFPKGLLESLIGLNRLKCQQTMEEVMGPSFDFESAHSVVMSYVDTHILDKGIATKPGLEFILDKLEELGIKKCVATSTDSQRAAHKLSIVGILHRFDVVVGGDQVKNSKPDPEIFQKAASLCGVSPSSAVVLEDSAAGAMGAYKAGMRVILVPDLVKPSTKTRGHSYAVCGDLFEAFDVISKMW